jgi:hypothetical protein
VATEQAEDYTFFYGEENKDHQLGKGSMYTRESYQQLREQRLLMTGCCI